MSKQSSTEYESFDEMDSMDGMAQSQLFYSLTIKSGDNESELEPPMIPGYVIHITSATFGVDVNKGSKTTVLTQTEPDGPFFPICKLIETHNETTNIDLLFDGPAIFKLKGRNVSDVTLNGYLEAPKDEDLEISDDLDDDMMKNMGYGDDAEFASADDDDINDDDDE
mmetsp:Transcript_78340/g.95868  ORF Transcript_78340/g.95868 Transcript_78340/m.95868 type:complete len:167 (-) Transcript_78340:114-614(-)